MTEKRFYVAESNLIDGYCVFDREKKYAFHPRPRKADCLNDVYILNELHEENLTLKLQLNLCSDQRNEFHRGARENANRVGKLERENKELKLLVQNWEALDEEKEGQLDKQNQALKKLKKENEQLKQEIETLQEQLVHFDIGD